MFKTLRTTIVTLLSAFTLMAVPLAVPAVVAADDPSGASIQDCLKTGVNLDTPSSDSNCAPTSSGTDASTSINTIIKTIINIFSLVVGVVAVIMIIAGGFRYIASGGDSNKITAAKNTIIYAIIGLVVVALAQLIVQFVLNKVTSATS